MSIAVGLLLMILFGASLSLSWSLLAAALQTPLSYPSATTLVISIASVIAACGFVARRTSRWWKGGLMALAVVFLNWGGWIFVSSRFRLPDAISIGVLGVGGDQLGWWLFTLFIGTIGALIAVDFRLRAPRIGSARPSSSLFVMAVWLVALLVCFGVALGERNLNRGAWVFHSSYNSPVALASYFSQIDSRKSSGVVGARHMRALAQSDGTQFDLFLYDLKTGLKVGIYDQDLHDRNPGDDCNYSFYGMNARRAFRPIGRSLAASKDNVIAVFNGGFFDAGPGRAYQAKHLSSIIYNGKMRYPVSRPAWTLAMVNDDVGRLSLGFVRSPANLPQAEFAISDVQALLADGRAVSDRPMPAMDDLRISRTSIGWDGSSRMYVLIVRDPDSEADSIRQAATAKQTGGWSVSQLRRFWQEMNVSNAVNLAGGDSCQMLYQWQRAGDSKQSMPSTRYQFIPSNGFGLTAGYLNNRPVRMEIPTLPPHLMSRGSLNYIYLHR